MGSSLKVLIIDYGMGNLGSVRRAFERCGAESFLSSDPADLTRADRIILPGVGSFQDGMANLNSAGWPAALKETLKNPAVSLLGICLGMQLLASVGHEGDVTPGLDIIKGEVVRFDATESKQRIPHVGWNEVNATGEHPLLGNLAAGTDFYFVHSFRFAAENPADVLATTSYCGVFPSVIGAGNVMGTQFHPEKSSHPGFQLIENFLHSC